MGFHQITVKVNGSQELVNVPSNMTLMMMLRESLSLTGTKNGCSAGECGACTVLMNGEPVNSCMVLAVEADGQEITTIEGLAKDGQLGCRPTNDHRKRWSTMRFLYTRHAHFRPGTTKSKPSPLRTGCG